MPLAPTLIVCSHQCPATGRVGACQASWIRIQPVDIDGSTHVLVVYAPRLGPHSFLIVSRRDDDAGIPESCFDLLHVAHQGIVRSVCRLLELVLDLVEDDGAALGDLVGGDDGTNFLDPWQPTLVVGAVAGPHGAKGAVGAVQREAASVGLGVAVGTSSGDDPDASVLGSIEQSLDILAGRFKIVDALGRGMVGPEEVDACSVEAGRFELLEDVWPQLGDRQSLVVELAGVDEDPRRRVSLEYLAGLPAASWR